MPRSRTLHIIGWLLRLVIETTSAAAMENTSLSSDVWNNVTTSSSDDVSATSNMSNVHDLVLKVIYIIIGTVGVVDNLFVIVIFIFFTKVTDKVILQFLIRLC